MSDATGSVKDFLAWQKALYHDEILRKMAQKSEWDLRQTAIVVASFGTLGTGCFAAAGTVANLIGCCEKTVKRHRADLIRLGWLTPAGKHRRAVVLSISNPSIAGHLRGALLEGHPDVPLVEGHETPDRGHLGVPLPVIDPKGSIPGDGSPEEGSADAAPEPSFCHEEKNHAATPASEMNSPGLAIVPDPDELSYPAGSRVYKCQQCGELCTVVVLYPSLGRFWCCDEHGTEVLDKIRSNADGRAA